MSAAVKCLPISIAQRALVAAVCLSALLSGPVASAKPGDLDGTFGSTGPGLTSNPIGDSTGISGINSVIALPDGKLLAAGYSKSATDYDFALARYNPNGTLDTTFGPEHTGTVTTAIGPSDDVAASVILLSSGKLLVAGRSSNATDYDLALARYNSDGTLDTSFGSNNQPAGTVTTPVGPGYDVAYSVTEVPGGKVVVAGSSREMASGSKYNFMLARYNPDGKLDTNFGQLNTGIVTSSLNSGLNVFRSIALSDNGSLVAVGYTFTSAATTNYDFVIARYSSNGVLDSTFGQNDEGIVTTPLGNLDDFAYSAVPVANGKIVVAGSRTSPKAQNSALVRYDSDGVLDTTFGPDHTGVTVVPPPDNYAAQPFSLAPLPGGKLVTAGYTQQGSSGKKDTQLIRYNSDGTVDTTFGPDQTGVVTNQISGQDDGANSVVALPNGKIVAAGYTTNSSDGINFALTRYEGDPIPESPPTNGSGGGSSKPPENPPTIPVTQIAKLAIVGKKATVSRKGKATIVVKCPKGTKATCKGVLKITAKLGKKTVTVATKSFTVPAGKQAKVAVKLSKKALKTLKKKKRLKAVAVANSMSVAVVATSIKTAVTLVLGKK